MEGCLLNKVIFLFIVSTLFLNACTPYGITGGPENRDSDDNGTTQEELEVMENPKTFSITIENFEENMQQKNSSALLSSTESGYITNNKLIGIDYKGEASDKNKPMSQLYILINQPGKTFDSIEKECMEILDMLFSSLEVSYDLDELLINIKNDKIILMDTEDVSVELTDNTQTIQMIIMPK